MPKKRILVLAGDGIGPEVTAEAVRVLEWFRDNRGFDISIERDLVGGAAIDRHGVPLTDDTLAAARAADAVLLGAVGGPKWSGAAYDKRPEAGLLRLRRELDLFANLRPAVVFDALIDASTLKPDVVRGLDVMIVRELTGGVYFGEPRGIFDIGGGERKGVNTQVYTTSEIRRIARVAFELAQKRGGRVCSTEKSNVMESGLLWREEVSRLHREEYPDITLSHMYADNCAMQLLRDPRQFDVIVTDNLFGDVLSDEAAMLTGSLGMLPSASLGNMIAEPAEATSLAPSFPSTGSGNSTRSGKAVAARAMYEPAHGSAPDIAGKGIANPLAAILSVAMMLRYSFAMENEAKTVENAVRNVLRKGVRTADLLAVGKPVSTREMGDAVIGEIRPA